MSSRATELAEGGPLPDPIVVFLAGAFVGLVVGPELVQTSAKLFRLRSDAIAKVLVERFFQALRDQSTGLEANINFRTKGV